MTPVKLFRGTLETPIPAPLTAPKEKYRQASMLLQHLFDVCLHLGLCNLYYLLQANPFLGGKGFASNGEAPGQCTNHIAFHCGALRKDPVLNAT